LVERIRGTDLGILERKKGSVKRPKLMGEETILEKWEVCKKEIEQKIRIWG
jgi:hypothetical protein